MTERRDQERIGTSLWPTDEISSILTYFCAGSLDAVDFKPILEGRIETNNILKKTDKKKQTAFFDQLPKRHGGQKPEQHKISGAAQGCSVIYYCTVHCIEVPFSFPP